MTTEPRQVIKVGNVQLGTIERVGDGWRAISGFHADDAIPVQRTRTDAKHALLAAYAVVIGPELARDRHPLAR